MILRSLKLATPATAFFVVVPLSVPPLGLFPIAIVIEAEEEVIVFPKLSWTTTVGGPDNAAPAPALPGCTEKASLFAAPALTLNALLVAPVRPVAEAASV